jgi:hypothetical protein
MSFSVPHSSPIYSHNVSSPITGLHCSTNITSHSRTIPPQISPPPTKKPYDHSLKLHCTIITFLRFNQENPALRDDFIAITDSITLTALHAHTVQQLGPAATGALLLFWAQIIAWGGKNVEVCAGFQRF